MGGALLKMVGGRRLVPQTVGRWEVETPATPLSGIIRCICLHIREQNN